MPLIVGATGHRVPGSAPRPSRPPEMSRNQGNGTAQAATGSGDGLCAACYLGAFLRSTPAWTRTKDVQSVCLIQFLLSMKCNVQASTRDRVAISVTSILKPRPDSGSQAMWETLHRTLSDCLTASGGSIRSLDRGHSRRGSRLRQSCSAKSTAGISMDKKPLEPAMPSSQLAHVHCTI